MASSNYQFFNFWIEDPMRDVLLPTKVTVVGGDSDSTNQNLKQVYPFVRNVRGMNLMDLEHFQYHSELPDGTVFSYKKVAGIESVLIEFPGIPTQVQKKELEVVNIIPAFEVVDSNGNFIGLVLCLSGTWAPPYQLVLVKVQNLNPFGYENWAAGGPTQSPTDKGLSWSGDTRPFEGDLPLKVFYTDTIHGQLIDLPARGESVPQLTLDTNINTTSGGWQGSAATFDSGVSHGVWAQRPYTYAYERSYSGRLVAGGNVLKNYYFTDIRQGGGYAEVWDGVDGGRAIAVLNARPAPTSPSVDGQDSWTVKYSADTLNTVLSIPGGYPGGTITAKNQSGTFWGDITISPINVTAGSKLDPNANKGDGGLVPIGDWTTMNAYLYGTLPQHIQEQINVSGNLFTITPLSLYNNTFENPIIVYPRYYDNNEFLISIQRGKQKAPPVGADVAITPTKWQYGIYRPGAGGGWTFPTEFPVVVTDPSSPVFGAHTIPNIQYEDNSVYCLGTFRLVQAKLVIN